MFYLVPHHHFSSTNDRGILSYECRVILALRALKRIPKLSFREAAKIYLISDRTLRRRRDGKLPRRDNSANLRNLTDLEEGMLLERILDLDARGFQPRLSDVQEMANRLRADRDASRVGPRWAEHFVNRHPEQTTRFRRAGSIIRGHNAKIQM